MCTQILVVDDDAMIRGFLQEVLTQCGYRVAEADDGVAALRQLESADALPDLILLDVLMPRMDGFEVLASLRDHPDWRRLPVIIMTAYPFELERGSEIEVALLRKPFPLTALLAAVERACGDPAVAVAP
jgi:CheY-like chemotaxis protein